MRILIVEDQADAARVLAKALREDAYAVDVATDGESAYATATVNDYDVIVLDVMLPRRDGFWVCRELRRARVSVPILMLTARDEIDARVAGLDAGADDYLVKPFDMARLDHELSRLAATVASVLQNELDEGLEPRAAAEDALAEVRADGRGLLILHGEGHVLAERWTHSHAAVSQDIRPVDGTATVNLPDGRWRMVSRMHAPAPGVYAIVALAPMSELTTDRAIVLRGLAIIMSNPERAKTAHASPTRVFTGSLLHGPSVPEHLRVDRRT